MTSVSLGQVLGHLRRLGGPPGGELRDEQLLERFVSDRDETAFAALLGRHGPMVLGVCRTVLRQEQDAEDAFQATFLKLAEKAATIRRRPSVGSWLYGVAYHLALRARTGRVRRRAHEQKVAARSAADPTLQLALEELWQVLHEELRRLSEKYRATLVLCHLEGHSQDEAARLLGWSVRRVKGRLQRGREQLRRRLSRRGLALPGGMLLTVLAVTPSSAALPAALRDSTVRVALARSAVSAKVAALLGSTDRVAASACPVLAALTLAAGLAAGLLAVGAGVLTARPQNRPAEEKIAAPAPKRLPDSAVVEEGGRVTVSSRVLDPDGKPVPGAQITMHHKERVRTGPDGRFRFSFAKAEANEANGNWRADSWPGSQVVAAAPGYGPEWTTIGTLARGNVTLRLVKDDVAINGCVKDLQGKPVVGASVWVAWLKKADDTMLVQHAWAGLTPNVVMDKHGRFTLRGIGRDRTAVLRVAGPNIEYKHEIPAVTRSLVDGKPARSVSVEVIAMPSKPIEGVVRAGDTGKPLAGVEVGARLADVPLVVYHYVATTDANGRYRITGVPKGASYEVRARPAKGQPYVPFTRRFGDTESLKPIKADFNLRRGVAIRFRLIDKGTGKPVQGIVQYDLVRANPHWAEACSPHSRNLLSSLEWFRSHVPDKDLTINMVVYPGPVVLIARAGFDGPPYLKARLDPADVAKGYYPGAKGEPINGFFEIANAYRRLDLKPTDKPVTFDLFLDPGRTLKGKLVGPDDKPVPGATAYGLSWQGTREGGRYSHAEVLKTADFAATSLDPNASYTLSFIHKERKLIGHVTVRGDAKGPLSVHLQRWGVVAGRLVDATGEPLAGRPLQLRYPALAEPGMRLLEQSWQTNGEGRFRVEGLLPGLKHELILGKSHTFKDLSVGPGQTRELGDIKLDPATLPRK
jgi:RNA polymerase sigma factor (sigma-70 family)